MRAPRVPATVLAFSLGLGAVGAGATAQSGKRAVGAGDWTMPGKDYSATRFSPLAELTPANVTQLKPVWNFSTGVIHGHEGQPLVVNRTMYVVTPYPNVLY